MKHVKTFENTSNRLFEVNSYDKNVEEFICSYTNELFFSDAEIEPDITFYNKSFDGEYHFDFRIKYVDELLFKNLNKFWKVFRIENHKIVTRTKYKVGFLFRFHETDIPSIFEDFKKISNNTSIIAKIDMILMQDSTDKYNL